MYKNVSDVGALASTKGNTNEDDLILISKKELATLKREREEYRAMCLDFEDALLCIRNQEHIETQGGVTL